ncbi:hypothetical protein P3W45_000196 [Vairimorpha bombi]|jgi:hypothetical protein
MLNSLQDTDFLVKGVPTINKLDLKNRSLVEALACVNIQYLIYVYSTPSTYKKSLRLLQKFISKGVRNKMAVEQIFLTCIKFNDYKLLDINMNVYTKLKGKEIDKLRLFYELRKKVLVVEDENIYHFNARASAVFERIRKKDFTYRYTDFFRKVSDTPGNYSCYDIRCGTDEYTSLLKRMDEYILHYPDHNIIFLYIYLSNMGCILNKCTEKCCKTNDDKLKETLLNPLYLNKIGEDDRTFIIKFYYCRKTVKYRTKYLKYKEVEPKQLTFKAVIDKNEMTRSTEYIAKRTKYASEKRKKIYKEEVKNILGVIYTKKVIQSFFKEDDLFKRKKNNFPKFLDKF